MKIFNTDQVGDSSLKILVYGESGAGKTTLAGTIKEPTLIISAEAGLLSLKGKKIDVIDLSLDDEGKVIPQENRIVRLSEVYKYLLTDEAKKKYKWIFVDSLTEISQNLMAALYKEFPERKDTLPMYGENSKRMRSIVKTFRDLPFYNVVITALSMVDKDENNQRYTGINIVGKLSDSLPAFFDEVFYLHVDKETSERVLVTEKSDKLVCKDRSGKLDKFEKPDLSQIASKILGEKKNAKH